MKNNIKFYLFYAVIFLIGASVSSAIFFAYGASIFPSEILKISNTFAFMDLIKLCAGFIFPITILFLSAFTIYSCAVSTFMCLYMSTILGRVVISYCISDHSFFTHGAILILFILFMSVFVICSKEASMCRAEMRYTAPEPSKIAKMTCSVKLFKTFTASVIALISGSVATYVLLLYFPV